MRASVGLGAPASTTGQRAAGSFPLPSAAERQILLAGRSVEDDEGPCALTTMHPLERLRHLRETDPVADQGFQVE